MARPDTSSSPENSYDVAIVMTAILATMIMGVGALIMLQTPQEPRDKSSFLPSATEQPSKRAYETFVAIYTPIWIALFGAIVVFQLYETFDEWSYLKVCVGLALPLLLQPVLWPKAGGTSPDANRSLMQRYSFKANLWIAIYSFIGTSLRHSSRH